LIPTLSCLSVNVRPAACLRLRCSWRYLCISPLHRQFRLPLLHSSPTVSTALPGLSPGISPLTYRTACAPFRPNKSGQRLHPTYYRGCWHVVSRCLFSRYRQTNAHIRLSSRAKEVYNPKTFIPHAAWLGQASAHCPIFPTAASRRSLARISVPVWLIILSDQLPIVALVGRYPTN
jgi:hypothetical protein